ncbi:MAG: hypothetical protein C4K47_02220 [Candidatus Thorarchaeota archaeon]|nr:MAG: hypothetical protein C4K47_02220 [Candidatus Thorarchaeota archaeon]
MYPFKMRLLDGGQYIKGHDVWSTTSKWTGTESSPSSGASLVEHLPAIDLLLRTEWMAVFAFS